MALCAPGAYLTHQQKVLRLYKRALRHLESWCIHRVFLSLHLYLNRTVNETLERKVAKILPPPYFVDRAHKCIQVKSSEDETVKQLQEETPSDGVMTEALPPARKEGDLPPLWWHIVTRPRERPV
ncbi:NADH dehydrogenase [ubiquinone] 1 beta subcomplex subunit 9 [Cricetulus griseus]|uniref:NADH dehydrogenase [ubiquinone] 1 beta subcomplex subunit 9 n=1 Tax=Cricetulus griseus TaxID=10029 RepID=G3IMH7_CRIGR|nr:NADH dehydrogenase [ubiquinone] 1 beta subcomplex subunit 9 [Cricetulus griseus]